ncbi:hypothetical protein SLS56_007625 [Neofusicoccum ribis]|uniref:Uncharacterized protein n=1 Tax=Neofusicoccum ribis TaxID=45134 RepID=A0ABR3SN72_9PEZI
MNFAPYQDASPENTRALSPPIRSPTHSPRPSLSTTRPSAHGRSGSALGTSALGAASPQYQNAAQQGGGYFGYQNAARGSADLERGGWSSPGGGWGPDGAVGGARGDLDLFETRLGIRMDWEACLAYLLLPPAGGVLLLVLEHRSDYVSPMQDIATTTAQKMHEMWMSNGEAVDDFPLAEAAGSFLGPRSDVILREL